MSERPDLDLPLDDRPGPALPISEPDARRMIDRALDAVTAPPSRGSARRARWIVPLAAALAIGGAAIAAVAIWSPVVEPPVQDDLRRAPPAPPAEAKEPASPAPLPSVESPPAKPSERRAKSERVAEDLLREANRLRGRQQWAEAAAAYAQVGARHPHSAAARVAAVAEASIRLEHLGDPRGALELYQRAERGAGALAPEIAIGIADAERALGDHLAERRALERLVAEHPDSPQAAAARRRLLERE